MNCWGFLSAACRCVLHSPHLWNWAVYWTGLLSSESLSFLLLAGNALKTLRSLHKISLLDSLAPKQRIPRNLLTWKTILFPGKGRLEFSQVFLLHGKPLSCPNQMPNSGIASLGLGIRVWGILDQFGILDQLNFYSMALNSGLCNFKDPESWWDFRVPAGAQEERLSLHKFSCLEPEAVSTRCQNSNFLSSSLVNPPYPYQVTWRPLLPFRIKR